MLELKGTGLGSGICLGKIITVADFSENNVAAGSFSGVESELSRLAEGIRITSEQYASDYENMLSVDPELAELPETYLLILESGELSDAAEGMIKTDGLTAEQAVARAGEDFAQLFSGSDDEYTAARASDILDISRKVAVNISGGSAALDIELPKDAPAVIAANDISPADLLRLISSGRRPSGIILAGGSVNGHTAIISRTFGIPAVIGLGGQLTRSFPALNGSVCAVDSSSGVVTVDPDDSFILSFRKKLSYLYEEKERLQQLRGVPTVTKRGRRIDLFCNISSPDDVSQVTENDGEGVGLFRSEFLYIGREGYPDEEEQYAAYSSVLAAMNGRPVIIRTCDIGSDKNASYMCLPAEDNPALGTRGIRLSLADPEMFRTQLRALYRASVKGDLRIMFPMISTVDELLTVKDICAGVRNDLASEGIPFDPNVRLGIMIETPSAALISDLLAENCDFFSIGTNDLTQYTMARDRSSESSEIRLYPAVMKLIQMTVSAAHEKGIPVGICGELASDTAALDMILDSGIDEVSVSPPDVLRVREYIIGHN